MIISAIEKYKELYSNFQFETINYIEKIFYVKEILQFKNKSYLFKGVRGKYDGLNNLALYFTFTYFDFDFEFIISYDQLEYYILRENSILKKCNLEDYTNNENEIILKFIEYLTTDLKSLEIIFKDEKKYNGPY